MTSRCENVAAFLTLSLFLELNPEGFLLPIPFPTISEDLSPLARPVYD